MLPEHDSEVGEIVIIRNGQDEPSEAEKEAAFREAAFRYQTQLDLILVKPEPRKRRRDRQN